MFVGRPTEAESLRFVELANGEVVELLVHNRPVELAVRAFIEAVQADEDERSQNSHRLFLLAADPS